MRWTPKILGIVLLGACADASGPDIPSTRNTVPESGSEGRGIFHRYTAIGTSVSMGWQSDGLVAASQRDSWPAQLARLAGREMTQPYIDGFGCRAPLAAPLASGRRTSGEPAAGPTGSFLCAPLVPGVALPAQNVALAGSTTLNALSTTPETQSDPFWSKLYPRVLPAGTTALRAAVGQHPKIVSVELGANEVLGARFGVAIPGVTIFPVAQFQALYSALTDTVAAASPRGILVGLIDDVATFPSFRRGSELWDDRATLLAAFHVEVSPDCDASQNLLFVTVRVPTAVATGLGRRQAGLSPFLLSCADGGTGVQDFVLTPAEAAIVNATMAAMDAHIAARASQLSFAHFRLEALYGRSDLKPPFSAVHLMTSATPYGSYVSLDGLHPSAQGHAALAQAAARAVNVRYGLGIPETAAFIAAR